jgi:DNA-binding NarL/FixJ family response regulator
MGIREASTQGELQSALDLIARRIRPQIILLESDYSVALAEWDTGIEIFAQLGLEARYAQRLLPHVETKVREIVERLSRDPLAPSSIAVDGAVIIRVCVLDSGGSLPRIALFVEPSRRREDLESAAKRFNLTQRQIEVLGFILQGLCAREIAETLSISETTVGDYFKQLLQKTAARNRADMVARVLNWTERIQTPRIPQKTGSST